MKYDLIIVGGGLVGAGLANALRQSHLRIALIDAKLPSSEDPRLFALNTSSCQFLENLRIWPELTAHATPIQQVHVSHQGHFGAVRLRAEDVSLPTLGYVIPAHYIEAALNKELNNLANCTVYRPAKLQAIQQEAGEVRLTITTETGEKTLIAPVVIGADGTESTVRAQLNIHTDIFDYDQSAIVTRTQLSRSHHQIAYERFHKEGAIAMLPLAENECATIWTVDNEKMKELMGLSNSAFLQALQTTFGYRLGRLQNIKQRYVFPLRMVRAEKAVVQSVFLLGNSAHTLHPIAAQGFNLALYEVAALAEKIIEKTTQREPLTALDLENISAQTLKQQAMSIGVSHRLPGFFTNQSTLMGLAVQVGMMGLDIATPIKKRFIKSMMGRTGRVPSLLLSHIL